MTKGFTLAEVLITLTILGVIAALVVPNIVQTYRKNIVQTKFKIAYSILTNLIDRINVDSFPLSFDTLVASEIPSTFAQNYFIPNLNIRQVCLENSIDCNPFGTSGTGGYVSCNNDVATQYPEKCFLCSNWASFKLANGMVLGILNKPKDASGGYIFAVDINGKKGPNKSGYDLFFFQYINRDKRLCGGVGYYACSNFVNRCNNSNKDECSRMIMNNGFKIPDNYPVKF